MKSTMLLVLGQLLFLQMHLIYYCCFYMSLEQLHLNQIKSFDFSLFGLTDQALYLELGLMLDFMLLDILLYNWNRQWAPL